jgi:hypothetical protein
MIASNEWKNFHPAMGLAGRKLEWGADPACGVGVYRRLDF